MNTTEHNNLVFFWLDGRRVAVYVRSTGSFVRTDSVHGVRHAGSVERVWDMLREDGMFDDLENELALQHEQAHAAA